MCKIKIYCCAAISGRDYDEVVGYYEQLRSDLTAYGLEPMIPMVRKDHDNTMPAHGQYAPESSDKAITNRDKWMVKSSDIVYANLLGAKHVSIGTCMELAWAYDSGRHIILAMEKHGNLHQHAFINTMADVVYDKHIDAMHYIRALADNLISK